MVNHCQVGFDTPTMNYSLVSGGKKRPPPRFDDHYARIDSLHEGGFADSEILHRPHPCRRDHYLVGRRVVITSNVSL